MKITSLIIKEFKKGLFLAFLFVLLSFVGLVGKAEAVFNPEINYQGKLTNSSDVNVADGTYYMNFNLYTALTGGSLVWTDDRSTNAGDRIDVSNGFFNVLLGSTSPLTAIDFYQTLYLEVQVCGTTGTPCETLTPRKKLGAVPAAFESDKLDGQDGSYYSNANNLTNFGSPFYSFFSATNTDALTEGSTNQYWTNERFDARLSATTTLPNLTTLLGLTNASTTQLSVSNNLYTALTTNSIPFISTDGLISEDTTNFVWDNTNKRIGIGTTTPGASLSVSGGNAIFDNEVYGNTFTASSTTVANIFPLASTTQLSVSDQSWFTNTVNVTAANDTASSSELITETADRDMSGANNWTGTNWTVGGDVYTHTAGANAATLAGYAATAGQYYKVVLTIVTTTAGTLTVTYGGAVSSPVGQETGTLTVYEVVLLATGTGGLVLTPDATWAGTIDDVSIRLLTPSASIITGKNAAAVTAVEHRASNATSFGIGLNSLLFNSGINNLALGTRSLYSNTTGVTNTAIGTNSLYSNTTGYQNLAVGVNSLYSNTTGVLNVALGFQSLYKNTTGRDNLAVGANSLYNNTTGYGNSALGVDSLTQNTTGYSNSVLGFDSLRNNNTGYRNSALGRASLYNNTTGNDNVAVGNNSLDSNTTGSFNTATGVQAGYNNSGAALQTNSYSTFLGYFANSSVDGITNSTAIGNTAQVTKSNQVVIGNASVVETLLRGNVGIGTTTPQWLLQANGTRPSFALSDSSAGVDSKHWLFSSMGGNLYIGTSTDLYATSTISALTVLNGGNVGIGTTTPATLLEVGTGDVTFDSYVSCTGYTSDANGKLICTTSDERLKTNISSLDKKSALDSVLALNPVSFEYKDSSRGVGQQLGLIAQQVQQVFPQAITITNPTELTPDGTMSVNYPALVSPIISAIQELNASTSPLVSAMFVDPVSGNIGIGTTTPEYKLQVEGDIAANSFVNVSTKTEKRDVVYLTEEDNGNILKKIMNLNTATYRYNRDTVDNKMRLGVIAEEAPEEILADSGRGVDLYKMITFILSGIKAQQVQIERLMALIGEAGDKIIDTISSKQVMIKDRLCIGNTCIYEIDLKKVLDNVGGSSSLPLAGGGEEGVDNNSTPPVVDTESPVISINGNNPTNISLGSSYVDLGALVTDNIDQNLGIKTFVNGVETNNVLVDTSVVGTTVIEYVSTDQTGNIATSTREVVVGEVVNNEDNTSVTEEVVASGIE